MNQELVTLVWKRASSRCEYCRFPSDFAWLPFQIDHIIAEKHRGQTVSEDLALSCYYRNSFKGPNIAGIDPGGEPDIAVQLFHPRQDDWNENFAWNGPELQGKSASGRATIAVLRINDFDSVETRRMLLDSGYQF